MSASELFNRADAEEDPLLLDSEAIAEATAPADIAEAAATDAAPGRGNEAAVGADFCSVGTDGLFSSAGVATGAAGAACSDGVVAEAAGGDAFFSSAGGATGAGCSAGVAAGGEARIACSAHEGAGACCSVGLVTTAASGSGVGASAVVALLCSASFTASAGFAVDSFGMSAEADSGFAEVSTLGSSGFAMSAAGAGECSSFLGASRNESSVLLPLFLSLPVIFRFPFLSSPFSLFSFLFYFFLLFSIYHRHRRRQVCVLASAASSASHQHQLRQSPKHPALRFRYDSQCY